MVVMQGVILLRLICKAVNKYIATHLEKERDEHLVGTICGRDWGIELTFVQP